MEIRQAWTSISSASALYEFFVKLSQQELDENVVILDLGLPPGLRCFQWVGWKHTKKLHWQKVKDMADDDKIEYLIRPKYYESVASAKCSKNHGCGDL